MVVNDINTRQFALYIIPHTTCHKLAAWKERRNRDRQDPSVFYTTSRRSNSHTAHQRKRRYNVPLCTL